MSDVPETFATRLRHARVAARMTYRVMSEATALSIAYLHDIENHRRPAPNKRMVSRIAEAIADWSDMRLRDRNELHHELRALSRAECIDRAIAKWERDE